MNKNSQIDDDQLNLIELIHTVWNGKWKIAVVVVLSFIATISYQSTKKNNFTATAKIQPLNPLEMNKYLAFNNLIKNANAISSTNTNIKGANYYFYNDNDAAKIPEITSLELLNLYVAILNDKSLFEDAIRKFNLLEASQYNNDHEYSEAIIRFSSSIKILSPAIKNLENSYHTINFTYDNVEKLKSFLTYVDDLANKLAKETIVKELNSTLLFLIEKKNLEINDIIAQIDNLYFDYERETNNYVLYLKEQLEIAKKLGIAKTTGLVNVFGEQNIMLSGVQKNSPYYLRGYEAIDKEIELIESRDNKKAFVKGLSELEKIKRAIEQDQTIKQIKLIINSVLQIDHKKFASSINVITTEIRYKNNKIMPVQAIVIGLIVGIFYILISNALQSQTVSKKTK